MRTLMIAGLLVIALPAFAQAQWATSRTELDWRLTLGGQEFGVLQQAVIIGNPDQISHRETTLYFGPYWAKSTRIRADRTLITVTVLAGLIGLAAAARQVAQRRPAKQAS